MATVSGACVMGLTYLSSSILRFLLLVSFYHCVLFYVIIVLCKSICVKTNFCFIRNQCESVVSWTILSSISGRKTTIEGSV